MRKSGDALAPIWPSALIVYVLIVLGILLFVVPKANTNVLSALLWGALFGAILYGVYDFTNHALIETWPLSIALIDLVWGMVLCGLMSAVTVYVQSRF